MGAYVNPAGTDKADWLERNGERLSGAPNSVDVDSGSLPVCLVDNGWMTAAGVAYSQGELAAFSDPWDQRPKVWYQVDIDLLLTVSDVAGYLNR